MTPSGSRSRASSTPTARAAGGSRALLAYLTALVGRERDGLLEVRWRHAHGMHRRVYRVADELRAAAAAIIELGARTDVYVGCVPRCQRPGGLQALGRVWVLWADCDSADAVAALHAFIPAPAIVVRSGTDQNRHAYWTLTGPLSSDVATACNRRLAHALGADDGAVTSAATILRPPGSCNFKHDPPAPVIAERLQAWRRISARTLAGGLPDPPAPRSITAQAHHDRSADGEDALRDVSPVVYVQALTGLWVGRDGKVSCPFHGEDRTPSLHVYQAPADGWYCYACARGGSIFDLAAEVFGLSTRGRDFIVLRRRLHAALSAWARATPDTQRNAVDEP